MKESDLFDYEPSRLRLADMIARDVHAQWVAAGRPKATRHRSITSARQRLQSGHGIGMVMLCALGQINGARGGR